MLFQLAEVGTEVTVVDQIAKLAWDNNRLYLEVHPNRSQLDNLEEIGYFDAEPIEGLLQLIQEAVGDHVDRLDHANIARAVRERRGVPVVIGRPFADKVRAQTDSHFENRQ